MDHLHHLCFYLDGTTASTRTKPQFPYNQDSFSKFTTIPIG